MSEESPSYKMNVEHRITKLEVSNQDILKLLDKIMNNHLVHLQMGIDEVQKKIIYVLWFFVVTLIGIIADLILRLIPVIGPK